MTPHDDGGEATTTSRGVRPWRVALLALGTILGFAALVKLVGGPVAFARSFAAIPPAGLAAATALTAANILVGTFRWRLLAIAYRATALPSYSRLARASFIAFFYNLLPGALAGDAVRAMTLKDSFGERGLSTSVALLLVDRGLGLAGLFTLVAFVAAISANDSSRTLYLGAAGLSVLATLGTIIVIGRAKDFARFLPKAIARQLETVPGHPRWSLVGVAFALSVCVHLIVALTGYSVAVALDPTIPWMTSPIAVPLASATAYIPVSIGGAGSRELALAALFQARHVSASHATTIGLGMLVATAMVATFGALLQFRRAS